MLKLFLSVLLFLQSAFLPLGLGQSNAQKWKLDNLPVYPDGYLCGTVYNAGAGLANEENGPTDEDSRMQIVSATTAEDFLSYCDTVEKEGFEKTYSASGDGITAAAFRGKDKFFYAYYCKKNGQARFIEDNGTNCFEDFGYTYSAGSEATVYQFDYPYQGPGEKKDEDIYSTNGMMYIIRLADNRLIVIDGGSIRQSADQNIEECMAFLHKITNTADTETVHIALWYGTHGHSDHITFFYKLLGFHHDTIDLERVMFNYPSLELVEHDGRTDMYRDRLAQFYPNVRYLKPHTGMTFDMGRTCSAAIERYVRGTPAPECGLSGEYDNGNGSLMRILPFALMMHYCTEYALRDPRDKLAVIHSASALTHAHERAQIGCGIYSLILWELLRDPCKASVTRGLYAAQAIYGNRKEFGAYSRIFDDGFAELPVEEIRSSGYVVDTLEAALWCLLRENRYDRCVLRAANLGEDTDTVAAVAGGLAGALFGLKAVQNSLAGRLLRRDYIEELCDKAAETWTA